MTFYFWKDKAGNKLTFKEFMSRWKSGINSIDALAQTKMQILSTWIVIVGISCGIVICIIGFKTLWWLMIILVGGIFNSLIQLLSLIQKKTLLQRFTKSLNNNKPLELDKENENLEEK